MMPIQHLIDFEQAVADIFNAGGLPYPIHLSGGNEKQLWKIFKRIKPEDWVFSTHRSHYHYLLKGGSPAKLIDMIVRGDSMHVYDRELRFYSSAIVSGCPTIATGLATQLTDSHVWCFIGDGAESEGSFYEAVRYADTQKLPITFIIEDNGLSVDTPTKRSRIKFPRNVIRYRYKRKWPHVGSGAIVKEYM
jgi:TPP-dependent pyruvate/acetoin dehydrogenase alpha subunit